MSIAYTYVGVRHFIDPDFFLAIMPNYLSFHLEIVYISGIAEIIFGVLLFFKKTRSFQVSPSSKNTSPKASLRPEGNFIILVSNTSISDPRSSKLNNSPGFIIVSFNRSIDS